MDGLKVSRPQLRARHSVVGKHWASRISRPLLVGPLIAFLLVTFVGPIAWFLYRSVDNREVAAALPRTVLVLRKEAREGTPEDEGYAALATDLIESRDTGIVAGLARRMNYQSPGFRSLVLKTADNLPSSAPSRSDARRVLLAIDSRWGDATLWNMLRQESGPWTSFYLLAALDLKQDYSKGIVAVPAEQSIYVDLLLRTFWISLSVTGLCFAIGFPLALFLSLLPSGLARLLLLLVLLPFWTSLLVRTAAWVVLFQNSGPVNQVLVQLGILDRPAQLIYNRFGVYVAMVHVLLPIMVLPIYSVMLGIPRNLMQAARSLGGGLFYSFWRVYLPLTLSGAMAGALLTFIMALGYYITPALVGGPADQMVSYQIARFAQDTVNWGMAAALALVLVVPTLVFYALFVRLVGLKRLSFG